MYPMIKISKLSKNYGPSLAINGIDLEFFENEQYSIKGASGSGKSTLLYLLGGLDRPSSGEIIVNQKNLNALDDEELAQYRNRFVGFVFQFHFLLSSMSALENIYLPARLSGLFNAEIEKRVKDLAKYLTVDHLLHKFPHQLSGGEQQRINIIRALSLRPKLLLCDEPTGNLDSQNSAKVIELLKQLSREFQSTLIVVTHDESIASTFNRRLQMRDGKIITL